MKKISNKDLNLMQNEKEIKIYISDIPKINSQLNWKPSTNCKSGITES